jgi:hypothetical protein
MITPADLIHIPYTPDLTQAGIAMVCRWLACAYPTDGQKTYISMRDRVTSTAADLAFRRYLDAERIPHTIQGSLPTADPTSYAVRLGGRRCILKSSLVFDRKAIHNINSQPSEILAHKAEVDVDDLEADPLLDEDLVIFALVPALITRRQSEMERALNAGQSACLIHILPECWSNPLPEAPLGEIAIKSNLPQAIKLQAGGRDPYGKFQEETLVFAPQVRTLLKNPYQSLAYLHTGQPVISQIGFSSPAFKAATIVQPDQWGNIWIYGLEIILAGYLTRAEFRRRGALQVNEDFNKAVTSGKKKSLPLGELHPLAGLFDWALHKT